MWIGIGIVLGMLFVGLLTLWLIIERGHPMRRSTWALIREGGIRRFLNLSWLHGLLYMRLEENYPRFIWRHLVRLRGPIWGIHRYHSKVLTHDAAKAIVTLDVNEEIPRQDLEHIIPYEKAREIVLQGPVDIVVMDCRCRANSKNPCEPRDVCMVIGQLFADLALQHQMKDARMVSQSEALQLLQEERDRGHVHTAWFNDAMLGRFYAICNCCSCCCGGIKAMRAGLPMVSSSGYVAQIEKGECTACATCVDACPFHALSMDGDWAAVNWDKCMGCGVCEGQCPSDAITLVRDERKGEPLDVRSLVQTGPNPAD